MPSSNHALILAPLATLLVTATAGAATYLGDLEARKERGFSRYVITEGGRTVWLAGRAALVDLNGKNIAGDFEAQTRTVLAQIDQTLREAGGSIRNVVTMTIFISDRRYNETFVQISKDVFGKLIPDFNYPASALITVTGFAREGVLIEIQATAVLDDRCTAANPCTPVPR